MEEATEKECTSLEILFIGGNSETMCSMGKAKKRGKITFSKDSMNMAPRNMESWNMDPTSMKGASKKMYSKDKELSPQTKVAILGHFIGGYNTATESSIGKMVIFIEDITTEEPEKGMENFIMNRQRAFA